MAGSHVGIGCSEVGGQFLAEVLGGLGIGISYIVIISTVNSWFPDRRGLSSGALMMGFGASTLLLGKVADKLFASPVGWRKTYIIIGIVIAAVVVLSSFAIKAPDKDTVLPEKKKSGKAKELLAILVDRKGGLVSSREAISLLWEDEEYDSVTQARFRKVAMRLNRELETIGIENIVEIIDRKRRINAQFVTCDLFEYLNGNPEYTERFDGNYMLNYSWGEYTLSKL